MALDAERLADGLWRWTARHPDWIPGDGWEPEVGCVYLERDDAVVLIDPLIPDEPADAERFLSALDADVERVGGPVAVLLTCAWHERSAPALAERYDATVYCPAGSRGPALAVDPQQLPDGARVHGVTAHLSGDHAGAEAVYELAALRTLVPGDVLLGDDEAGLCVAPARWFAASADLRAWYRDELPGFLARLAALQPERVLCSHGAPLMSGAAAHLSRLAAA